ncbi:winged helix DNA-binding protein [Pseudoroseomonas cervicalis]|uniref:winged helix DNA-binding protein n=1 Tax=Teichococcus cervicalis TaxID=204525 RepID=UPI0022F1D9BD|nr:winged helix DNA-binding protein [Pseudoroseomonas cervicalis]WBV44223.1 winged helix DNA-binding protein [Pseudoroseomonas cervicalis]
MSTPPHPIVSAAHLAEGAAPALSEVEYGLNILGAAYHRWMVRCATAAGQPGLSALEVVVVNTIRHRGRPKRQAEIALALAIDDAHLLTYALRKLERLGLVASTRQGKEKVVSVTEAGQEFCARYTAIREAALAGPVASHGPDPARLSALAALLRSLSGHYEQAARAAATF